jgi:D-amino-acid dehydrogenase
MSRTAAPRHVAVAGAGMLGLSAAWFLQEHGIQVTVLERDQVAAGASWGNAGWITPALAAPLPEPAMLRAGLAGLFAPKSPVSVPPQGGAGLLAFLWEFSRHCTSRRWQRSMSALTGLTGPAVAAYGELTGGGVAAPVHAARPLLAGYRTAAERAALVTELQHVRSGGGAAEFELLDGPAIQQAEPALSDAVQAAVIVHGQHYIDPGGFAAALADSVRQRGGTILEQAPVTGIRADGSGVLVSQRGGESRYDAAVLATGAWLGMLARGLGVRTRVQSGRGYSFAMPAGRPPRGPLYFPAARLACTPRPDGSLRVAGIMELRAPGAGPARRRFELMAEAVRPLLTEAQPERRTAEWVGARPLTPDGLPIIGQTAAERVFVAGGHGMWGITLGPVSGRLLAEQIASGDRPAALAPFDPLR